jgi:hypothetical protein
MFICPKCGKTTTIPSCINFGYVFPVLNGIYQMTDMPNMNLDDSKGDKYIGYDKPGK